MTTPPLQKSITTPPVYSFFTYWYSENFRLQCNFYGAGLKTKSLFLNKYISYKIFLKS
jgi:hypothetical protein